MSVHEGNEYVVDSHHHFQDVERFDYPWLRPDRPQPLEGDLSAIRRNYLPGEYREIVSSWPVGKTVHVQNGWSENDPVGETKWLSSLMSQHGLPTAVVGYADLSKVDVGDVLSEHMKFPGFRGIRQILNWHEDPVLRVASRPDLMEQAAWRRGFGQLSELGLSFDLQIYWPQMALAAELAQDFPSTDIILNHFGMPIDRSSAGLRRWEQALRGLAEAQNVSVKLSGFGLGHPRWTSADTAPVLKTVISTFGPDRVMFGSNLPVDLLFSPGQKLFDTLEAAITPFSHEDRIKMRRSNAERVYRI